MSALPKRSGREKGESAPVDDVAPTGGGKRRKVKVDAADEGGKKTRKKRARAAAPVVPAKLARRAASARFQSALQDALQQNWPLDSVEPNWPAVAAAVDVPRDTIEVLMTSACERSSAFREFVCVIRSNRPAPVLARSASSTHKQGPLDRLSGEALRCFLFSGRRSKEMLQKWRRLEKRLGPAVRNELELLADRGFVSVTDQTVSRAWTALLKPDSRYFEENSDATLSALRGLAAGRLCAERDGAAAGAALSDTSVLADELMRVVGEAGCEGLAMQSWLRSKRDAGLVVLLEMWSGGRVLVLSGRSDCWIVLPTHRELYSEGGVLLSALVTLSGDTAPTLKEWEEVVLQHVYKHPSIQLKELDRRLCLGQGALFALAASLRKKGSLEWFANDEGSIGLIANKNCEVVW